MTKKTQRKDFVTHDKGVSVQFKLKTVAKMFLHLDHLGAIHKLFLEYEFKKCTLSDIVTSSMATFDVEGSYHKNLYNNLHFEPIFPTACSCMRMSLFQYSVDRKFACLR